MHAASTLIICKLFMPKSHVCVPLQPPSAGKVDSGEALAANYTLAGHSGKTTVLTGYIHLRAAIWGTILWKSASNWLKSLNFALASQS